jgi:hypothetical protein
MDDPKQDEGAAAAEPAYFYKPSLMGAPWLLRLMPDHLAWTLGGRTGTVAYRDIARIRLSFRPVTTQSRRYLTEIWAPGAPKIVIASASWKSMTLQESQGGAYSAFLRELHARIAAVDGRPQCLSGTNPFIYWPGLVIYVAVLVALAALTVTALRQSSYPGALFVGGFAALFGWQLGNFFKLNRPGPYPVDAPPQDLLPKS